MANNLGSRVTGLSASISTNAERNAANDGDPSGGASLLDNPEPQTSSYGRNQRGNVGASSAQAQSGTSTSTAQINPRQRSNRGRNPNAGRRGGRAHTHGNADATPTVNPGSASPGSGKFLVDGAKLAESEQTTSLDDSPSLELESESQLSPLLGGFHVPSLLGRSLDAGGASLLLRAQELDAGDDELPSYPAQDDLSDDGYISSSYNSENQSVYNCSVESSPLLRGFPSPPGGGASLVETPSPFKDLETRRPFQDKTPSESAPAKLGGKQSGLNTFLEPPSTPESPSIGKATGTSLINGFGTFLSGTAANSLPVLANGSPSKCTQTDCNTSEAVNSGMIGQYTTPLTQTRPLPMGSGYGNDLDIVQSPTGYRAFLNPHAGAYVNPTNGNTLSSMNSMAPQDRSTIQGPTTPFRRTMFHGNSARELNNEMRNRQEVNNQLLNQLGNTVGNHYNSPRLAGITSPNLRGMMSPSLRGMASPSLHGIASPLLRSTNALGPVNPNPQTRPFIGGHHPNGLMMNPPTTRGMGDDAMRRATELGLQTLRERGGMPNQEASAVYGEVCSPGSPFSAASRTVPRSFAPRQPATFDQPPPAFNLRQGLVRPTGPGQLGGHQQGRAGANVPAFVANSGGNVTAAGPDPFDSGRPAFLALEQYAPPASAPASAPAEVTKPRSAQLSALLATPTGRPAISVALSEQYFPFVVGTSQATSVCHFGVVKIKNIPYNTTVGEILAVIGRNARLPADSHEPVHIIMDKVTSKTQDAYVEFASLRDAERALDRVQEGIQRKRHPRLGERIVEVELSSQADLCRDLFPFAQGVVWEGNLPVIQPEVPGEPWKSFRGFVTDEELIVVTSHVKNPARSPFSRDCPQRPFEGLISTIKKYPWFLASHITMRERHFIYSTALKMCWFLRERLSSNNKGDQDRRLSPVLLKRLVIACLLCPGFSATMKDNIAVVSNFQGNLRQYNQPLYADHWRHLHNVVPKPGSTADTMEWYMTLIREETICDLAEKDQDKLQRALQIAEACGTTGYMGFVWVEIDLPQNPDETNSMTLDWVGEREIRTLRDIVFRALTRAELTEGATNF
ncbi:hypothetical protein OQA88_4502 [Cercophora sp. LCS_1]